MQHNLNVKLIALLLVAITGSAYAQQDAYAASLDLNAEVKGTSIIFSWNDITETESFTYYALILESASAEIQTSADDTEYVLNDLYGASPGDRLVWKIEARDSNRSAQWGGPYIVASDTLTVTISGNGAPRVNAGNDVIAVSNEQITLTGIISDPNGDEFTHVWRQTSGTTLFADWVGYLLKFTAPVVTSGEQVLVFNLTANDGSLTTEDSVTVTVKNSRPVADAGSDKTVTNGTRVTLDARNSSDRDGNLTYLWEQVSGTSVNFDSAKSWTNFNAPSTAADLVFKLTVNDSEYDSTDMITINVIENSPPDANIVNIESSMHGERVILNGTTTTDPDNDRLSYKWTQTKGHQVTISNARSSIASFIVPGVTNDDPKRDAQFVLTVNDGMFSDSETVNLVFAQNDAPLASAIGYVSDEHVDIIAIGSDVNNRANYLAPHGVKFILDGSASSDNDSLSYAWKQISGTTVRLSDANTAVASFNTGVSTSPVLLKFELTASDGFGGSDKTTLAVGVDARLSSTVKAGSDQTVRGGEYIALDGSNSVPGSGYTTYSWEQIGGTSVLINDEYGAYAGFTAPSGDNVLTLQLTMTDGIYSSSDTVRITVNGIEVSNVNAGNDQTVRYGEHVDLSGFVSNNDGTLSYDWYVTSGPGAYIVDYDTLTPYFEAPYVVGTETMVIELTVFNNYGGLDTDTVTITVNENNAPIADIKEDYQWVVAGDRVILDASDSYDPDNESLTYEWVREYGPEITIIGSGDRVSFIAPTVPEGRYAGSIYMVLRVSDGALTDEIYFSVDVTNNAKPVVNTQSSVTVSSGSAFTLTATVTDDNMDEIYAYWADLEGDVTYVSQNDDVGAGTYAITFNAPTVTSGTEILKFEFCTSDYDWWFCEPVTVTVRP